jgi:hypothetical protein
VGVEAPTLSVGAMASEVGVSRITLSKHIRESRVTADAFEGNRTIPAGISDARES